MLCQGTLFHLMVNTVQAIEGMEIGRIRYEALVRVDLDDAGDVLGKHFLKYPLEARIADVLYQQVAITNSAGGRSGSAAVKSASTSRSVSAKWGYRAAQAAR